MAIKRRKTEEVRKCPNTGIDCVVWELEFDGEVVGMAVATYKTPTQRTWDAEATLDGVAAHVEGASSIAKAVAELSLELAAAGSEDETDDTVDATIEITEAEGETA